MTQTTTEHGYTADKEAYLLRLKRIDVLTQVSAVNKALHAVSIGLLEEHIAHCVVGAANESQASGDPRAVNEKVQEATAAISRLLR